MCSRSTTLSLPAGPYNTFAAADSDFELATTGDGGVGTQAVAQTRKRRPVARAALKRFSNFHEERAAAEPAVASTTVPVQEFTSSWFPSANAKLLKLRDETIDWKEIGVPSPTVKSLNAAATVLRFLDAIDFEPHHITPSAEGGVCITFERGLKYADIECFNDGEVFTAECSGSAAAVVKSFAPEDIESAILELNDFLDR